MFPALKERTETYTSGGGVDEGYIEVERRQKPEPQVRFLPWTVKVCVAQSNSLIACSPLKKEIAGRRDKVAERNAERDNHLIFKVRSLPGPWNFCLPSTAAVGEPDHTAKEVKIKHGSIEHSEPARSIGSRAENA